MHPKKLFLLFFPLFSNHLHAIQKSLQPRLSLTEFHVNFCQVDDNTIREKEFCREELVYDENNGQTTKLTTRGIEGFDDKPYKADFLGQTKKANTQDLSDKKGGDKGYGIHKPMVLDDMMGEIFNKMGKNMPFQKKRRKSLPVALYILPSTQSIIQQKKTAQFIPKKTTGIVYSPISTVYHENKLKVAEVLTPYVVPLIVTLTLPSSDVETEQEQFLLASTSWMYDFSIGLVRLVLTDYIETSVRNKLLAASSVAREYKKYVTICSKTLFYGLSMGINQRIENRRYGLKFSNNELFNLISIKSIFNAIIFSIQESKTVKGFLCGQENESEDEEKEQCSLPLYDIGWSILQTGIMYGVDSKLNGSLFKQRPNPTLLVY